MIKPEEKNKLVHPVAIRVMKKLRADGVFDSVESLKAYVDAHREKRRKFIINRCYKTKPIGAMILEIQQLKAKLALAKIQSKGIKKQ